MVAHAPPPLIRNYVVYSYIDEKKRGFQVWHQRLDRILRQLPEPTNVVALHG
ncbi:hypothetical protein ACVIHH_000249 [Bradyrhizobium sp. USDA 4518]